MHERDADLSCCADATEGDSSFGKMSYACHMNILGCFVHALPSDGSMDSFARFLQSHGLLASFTRLSRPRTGLNSFVRAPSALRRRVLGFVRALTASPSLRTRLPFREDWVRFAGSVADRTTSAGPVEPETASTTDIARISRCATTWRHENHHGFRSKAGCSMERGAPWLRDNDGVRPRCMNHNR